MEDDSRAEQIRRIASLVFDIERSDEKGDGVAFVLRGLLEKEMESADLSGLGGELLTAERARLNSESMAAGLNEKCRELDCKNEELRAKIADLEAQLDSKQHELDAALHPIASVDPSNELTVPNANNPLASLSSDLWHVCRHPKPKGWDAKTAYVMARLSEVIYWKLSQMEREEAVRHGVFEPSITQRFLLDQKKSVNVLDGAGLEDLQVSFLERRGYIYITVAGNDFAIVAVRGTYMFSLTDWLIDLNAAKYESAAGFYHEGFALEADKVLSELEGLIGKGKRVYFTGHSLGGAVASILCQQWPDQVNVQTPYVFASPRFAWAQQAEQSRRYMFQKSNDPVPHLPPRSWGFSDRGTEQVILPIGAQQSTGAMALFRLFRGVGEHSIEGIRSELGQLSGEHYASEVFIEQFERQLVS